MGSDFDYGGVIDRILERKGDLSEAELAAGLGISPNTWTAYKKAKSSFGLHEIAGICDVLKVDPVWLLFGDTDHANTSSMQLWADDLIRLPQFDVRASAGSGEIAYAEHPVNEVTFERRFLRDLGAIPEQCFLMWATGDSMLPTFPDGAMLVVDQSQRIVDDGRIYVFNVRGALLVKRARWRMDGRLDLVSDNAGGNYPVETFETDRFEDLIIVGRVIYFGRPV